MKKFILSTLASLFIATSIQASPLEDLIKSGNTLWSQGKLTEAETEFKKAIEIDPDSSLAHSRMANLYLTQNNSQKAAKEFQKAIINDPENARLFIGLAITYLHLNYHQMAEAMVNQAIELDPTLANAKKLKTYMDAKSEQRSQQAQTEKVSTDGGMASPHGQVSSTSSMPATIMKNSKTAH